MPATVSATCTRCRRCLPLAGGGKRLSRSGTRGSTMLVARGTLYAKTQAGQLRKDVASGTVQLQERENMARGRTRDLGAAGCLRAL